MKLEINERKKYRKICKYVEIKQDVTKQQRGHQRSQRRNQNIPRDKLKQKYSIPNFTHHSKSSSKREVVSNAGMPQEINKKIPSK